MLPSLSFVSCSAGKWLSFKLKKNARWTKCIKIYFKSRYEHKIYFKPNNVDSKQQYDLLKWPRRSGNCDRKIIRQPIRNVIKDLALKMLRSNVKISSV